LNFAKQKTKQKKQQRVSQCWEHCVVHVAPLARWRENQSSYRW